MRVSKRARVRGREMERGRVSANGAWGRKAVAQIELIARHRYVYKQARERQP